MSDKEVLSNLGKIYSYYANSDENKKRMQLHSKVNDLKPARPILLIDEFPWHELNFDNKLDLECEDKRCRNIESCLKKEILKWECFPGDMVLPTYYGVNKKVDGFDIGVKILDEKMAMDTNNNIVSHHYINQLKSYDDKNFNFSMSRC